MRASFLTLILRGGATPSFGEATSTRHVARGRAMARLAHDCSMQQQHQCRRCSGEGVLVGRQCTSNACSPPTQLGRAAAAGGRRPPWGGRPTPDKDRSIKERMLSRHSSYPTSCCRFLRGAGVCHHSRSLCKRVPQVVPQVCPQLRVVRIMRAGFVQLGGRQGTRSESVDDVGVKARLEKRPKQALAANPPPPPKFSRTSRSRTVPSGPAAGGLPSQLSRRSTCTCAPSTSDESESGSPKKAPRHRGRVG